MEEKIHTFTEDTVKKWTILFECISSCQGNYTLVAYIGDVFAGILQCVKRLDNLIGVTEKLELIEKENKRILKENESLREDMAVLKNMKEDMAVLMNMKKDMAVLQNMKEDMAVLMNMKKDMDQIKEELGKVKAKPEHSVSNQMINIESEGFEEQLNTLKSRVEHIRNNQADSFLLLCRTSGKDLCFRNMGGRNLVLDRFLPNDNKLVGPDGRLILYHEHGFSNQRWRLVQRNTCFQIQCKYGGGYVALREECGPVFEAVQDDENTLLDLQYAGNGCWYIKSHKHNTYLDIDGIPEDFTQLHGKRFDPSRETQKWAISLFEKSEYDT